MYSQGWLTFLIQVISLSVAESQTLAITYWLPYAEQCCNVPCHWLPHIYRLNSRAWDRMQGAQGQLLWHWIIYLRSKITPILWPEIQYSHEQGGITIVLSPLR